MNKNYIYIGIALVIVILIGGGLLFFNQSENNSSNPSQSSNSGQSSNSDVSENFPTEKYMAYSQEKFESTSGKKLLYFYANWCPTCRPVNIELQEKTDEIPDDLTIFRINYADSDTDDIEKNLAREHNVTYQHTFVLFDENGQELRRWNGGGLAAILQILN